MSYDEPYGDRYDDPAIDRDAVPHDIDAERAALGAMLIAPKLTVHDVSAMLRGEDYYRPAHEAIHNAIVYLFDRQEPVDMVTVSGELSRTKQLDKVGGVPYVHGLVEFVPTASSATYYAKKVSDKAILRRLVAAGTKVSQLGRTSDDPEQAGQDAQQAVAEAAAFAQSTAGGAAVGDALLGAIDWLENEPKGASTPWPDVNDRTNGLLAGQMITVAARPGHGKSLVAKDVALHTAKLGRPVHVATLEMSRNEYLARILAGLAKVDLSRMLKRQMTNQDWDAIRKWDNHVRELPLWLDDRESQTMAQIRAAARQTSQRFGAPLGLIAIDYAQLVRPAKRLNVREQEVAQISRDTKLLAKEHDCPVLLLAQLNRGNTQRSDHTPISSDLRESGSLEQDSDQVWLLHRPDQYPGGEERFGEVDLIIGKNRNGPWPTTVSLSFQGHYGRIESLWRGAA